MPRKRLNKEQALREALALLQENGYSIKSPDLELERQKQELNEQALGIVKPARTVKDKPSKGKQKFICTLYLSHSINGRSYGPGVVECPSVDIMHTLLHQDKAFIKQQQSDFATQGRMRMVVERTDNSGGRVAAVGIDVNPSIMNSPELPDNLLYTHIEGQSI